MHNCSKMLSRLVFRKVVLPQIPRRNCLHAPSLLKTDTQDINEDVIFNTLAGGLKHRKRKIREDQLKKEHSRRFLVNPETPVSLNFLAPEYRAKLLGDSALQTNRQIPISSSKQDLFQLARKLEVQQLEEPKNEVDSFEDEHLLDFMTSTDHEPRIPASNVPCGGCGAMLHCQDPGYPGFIPVDCFYKVSPMHLRAQICQRCYILKHHKKALQLDVSPDEYPRILQQIKEKRALVILIVDLMDFPCSIWPHLNDIIGEHSKNLLLA